MWGRWVPYRGYPTHILCQNLVFCVQISLHIRLHLSIYPDHTVVNHNQAFVLELQAGIMTTIQKVKIGGQRG